jgi:hypothetical protein
MRTRLAVAALLLSVVAFAQNLSVDQLVGMLRSDIKLKIADKEVAAFLSKVHLTQKLDDKIVEQLQSEGLGSKTVAALRNLATASASLPAPEVKKPEPPPATIPPPSPETQKQVENDAREYAMNYSKSLPNFICAQVTRRSGDPTGSGKDYRLYDTVVAKLTYFDQHEKYETISINDKFTTQSFESLGGSISTGEFGSMLQGIFDPQSAAEFQWVRWATLRGHRAHVFGYTVDQPHSRWQIEDRQSKEHIIPAYVGQVWVDSRDHSVLAFTVKAVDIPATFPIREADSRLDYDVIDISGVPSVLPSKAEMHLRSGKEDQKNEIAFRAYHKYEVGTTLKFDDIVEDTKKEDKAKAK